MNDDYQVRYVCAARGEQTKKENMSHLAMATSDRDVIQ
jgi:hypothetical protein